ncbi:MAG: DEAD/DEAH box helicase [Gemmataceae bacterium]
MVDLEVAGTGFAALGLDPQLAEALAGLGYDEPTPIQRQAIPPILGGRDVLGQAGTGTGKTAAFGLPLLHRLASPDAARAQPSALVLVPTRELAIQVAEALRRYGRPLGASVLAVCGGQPFGPQLQALRQGIDVVVATPGRALDHVRRGTLALDGVATVVLDEADEMLDMGFAEELDAILAETPDGRQTLLFSATLPDRVAAVARRHLNDPVSIRVERERAKAGAVPKVRQAAYFVAREHKAAALVRVLALEGPAAALVFCRMRSDVDDLTEALRGKGYKPEALHGGMSQEQRDRVMRLFRAGTASVLVATDVAARGLDIDHLTHVINYDLPDDPESYVHRVGRVGRAGREGVALTIAVPGQQRRLRDIEYATGQKIEVARLPGVADLRARRLNRTRDALKAAILEGGLEEFREVVESLSAEFDAADVALAAVKLASRTGAGAAEEAEEIPTPRVVPEKKSEFAPRPGKPAARRASRNTIPAPGMVRIFVAAGRMDGIQPRDLVGAIANEAGVPGHDIGCVDVAERFSLVDVPEEVAEYVIDSLRGARIKGRKFPVRRDRG